MIEIKLNAFTAYDWIMLATSFCGGFILLSLDLYLRKKKVKDPTLFWIYLGIFSWFIRTFISVGDVGASTPKENALSFRDTLTYYLSPITNIVFSIAAFRYSRVKENDNFQKYFKPVLWIVCICAILTWVLLKSELKIPGTNLHIGSGIDVIASLITIWILATALGYSFKIYNFRTLFTFTLVVFVGVAIFQVLFYIRSYLGTYLGELLLGKAIFNIGLISLFIAQPSVWGLSTFASQNFVGSPVKVSIIAAVFDLRGSTKWVKEELKGNGFYLKDFLKALKEFLEENIPKKDELSAQKFLGDGYLFVWEINGTTKANQIERLSEYAVKSYEGYPKEVLQKISQKDEDWQGAPGSLGIGLVEGTAWRLILENGSRDYVGDIMNLVSKLQDKARPDGGVIVNCKILEGLQKNSKDRTFFPVRKKIKLLGDIIEVGATENVKLEGEDSDGFCKE